MTTLKRFWYVDATLAKTLADKSIVTLQVPTFVLDGNILGIVDRYHAERIAHGLLMTAAYNDNNVTANLLAYPSDMEVSIDDTVAKLMQEEQAYRMASTEAVANRATTVSGKTYSRGYATAFDDAATMLTTLRLELQDTIKKADVPKITPTRREVVDLPLTVLQDNYDHALLYHEAGHQDYPYEVVATCAQDLANYYAIRASVFRAASR